MTDPSSRLTGFLPHSPQFSQLRGSESTVVRPILQAHLLCSRNAAEHVRRSIDSVLDWARSRWPAEIPSDREACLEFEHDQPGLKLGAVNLPEQAIWGFRAEHSDSKIAGRVWLIEVAIEFPDTSNLVLHARSQCSAGADPIVPIARPGFLRRWVEQLQPRDGGILLQPCAGLLGNREQLVTLGDLLKAQTRELPVIIAAEERPGGFALDLQTLATRSCGLAHVFTATTEMLADLASVISEGREVARGAVCVCPPRTFSGDDAEISALYLPSRIRSWRGQHGEGYGPFLEFLLEQVHRFSVSTPAQLDRMPSYLRLRGARVERDLQLHREKSIRGQTTQANSNGEGALQALHSRIEELELESGLLRLEKQDADRRVGDAELLFAEQAQDLKALREERDALRATADTLLDGLRRARHVQRDEADPTDYGHFAAWADRTLSDHVVLLPRARRALKEAQFQDPALVAACLRLLGREYWAMRTASISERAAAKEAYERRLEQLKVDEAPSIATSTLGQYPEQYWVNYSIGHRSRQLLERHLRGGANTRDPRFCLRIYFFWDDDQQRIVIGHLTNHLDNSLS